MPSMHLPSLATETARLPAVPVYGQMPMYHWLPYTPTRVRSAILSWSSCPQRRGLAYGRRMVYMESGARMDWKPAVRPKVLAWLTIWKSVWLSRNCSAAAVRHTAFSQGSARSQVIRLMTGADRGNHRRFGYLLCRD